MKETKKATTPITEKVVSELTEDPIDETQPVYGEAVETNPDKIYAGIGPAPYGYVQETIRDYFDKAFIKLSETGQGEHLTRAQVRAMVEGALNTL